MNQSPQVRLSDFLENGDAGDQSGGGGNADGGTDGLGPYLEAQRALEEIQELTDLGPEDLDFSHLEIDLDEVDDDLVKFQEDTVIQEALKKGVDLSQYARQIEAELRGQELLCIQDYLDNAEDIAQLHSQIQDCDSILARMEDILDTFKTDLGSINSEIKMLQDESAAMDIKFRNRKNVEGKLSTLVDSILLPDHVIEGITNGPLGPAYTPHLRFLNQKIRALKNPEVQRTRAAEEVAPVVKALQQKAAQRIRSYLFQQFNNFRKPKTNVQINQDVLLRCRYLYHALVEMCQDDHSVAGVCEEIRESYVQIMSAMYHQKFRTYLSNLKRRLQKFAVSKADLLGTDETRSGGLFTTKRSSEQLNRVFTLGDRFRVLVDQDKDYIIFHVAQSSGQRFPFERIFRSAQRLLMDSANWEFNFIAQFFGDLRSSEDGMEREETSGEGSRPLLANPKLSPSTSGGGSGKNDQEHETASPPPDIRPLRRELDPDAEQRTRDLFQQVFGKTLELFTGFLEEALSSNHDSLGVLLLLRILSQHNHVMQRSRVSCLDTYFDRINLILWPSFKTIFDANLASLRSVKDSTVKRGQVEPHLVTGRYARYVAGILTLNQGYSDGILINNLELLRAEMEKFLLRTAAKVRDSKAQMVYLIGNYSLILRILRKTQDTHIRDLTRTGVTGGGGSLGSLPVLRGESSNRDTPDEAKGNPVSAVETTEDVPRILDIGQESGEAQVFGENLAQQIGLYVEYEVQEKFGKLVRFVQEHSQPLEEEEESGQGQEARIQKITEAAIEGVVQQFSREWRSGMSNMHDSVMRDFSNLVEEGASEEDREAQKDMAREILKRSMIQLVLYYQRFQNLIQKWRQLRASGGNPKFLKDVVSIQAIKAEIKKYGRQ